MMRARQLLGDLGLAVLLVLPTAALSRPEPSNSPDAETQKAPSAPQVALTERSPLDQRFSLPG